MRLLSVLLLVYFFSPCSSQNELIRLGTVEEVNARTKATNGQPLLIVQNIVYAVPPDCFCNRDADNNASQRDSGKDDLARNRDNQSSDRAADSDDLGRSSSGQNADRDLATDFIYREDSGSSEGRGSGNDDANRDSGVANADRKSAGDAKGRNLGNAAKGRNSGNAANGRNANSAKLGRNFTTVHTVPSCLKAKDSCSIEVLGFHPKARIEYFDKVESIKAVEMVIKF
jgi:hypothetical protein